jgi:hypothetical protein
MGIKGEAKLAFRWDGGIVGSATIEDMHAAGVQVRLAEGEGGGNQCLVLYDGERMAQVIVRPGEWVVAGHRGWTRATSEPKDDHYDVDVIGHSVDLDPLPGIAHLHFERAGYRRQGPGALWEYRHNGLSVEEMRTQGWQPLYVAWGEADWPDGKHARP